MVRQQTDGLDERDVVLGRVGSQQREPDRDSIAVGAVPHQPSPGLPHLLPIGAQRRDNDVVVAMDRDVDIAEGVDKFTRLRVRLAEMSVEDDSDIGPVEPLISRSPV
ncbi:hypothetical protein Areg01_81450 [Actinoplanes regularis]|nr:hypothetical protein Areg01_81450 [Actinoplanes regularis]